MTQPRKSDTASNHHVWRWDDGERCLAFYGGDGLRVSLSLEFEHSVELSRDQALDLVQWLNAQLRGDR